MCVVLGIQGDLQRKEMTKSLCHQPELQTCKTCQWQFNFYAPLIVSYLLLFVSAFPPANEAFTLITSCNILLGWSSCFLSAVCKRRTTASGKFASDVILKATCPAPNQVSPDCLAYQLINQEEGTVLKILKVLKHLSLRNFGRFGRWHRIRLISSSFFWIHRGRSKAERKSHWLAGRPACPAD